ncbi:unnamed protein product [Linum tenue]|uniref:Transcription repressor n=1 Tax=Linum tenue TaxID=586396 RepID=A0AAV0S6T6_9ROSI|nr:unnamed protein product [Linum tenue]
MFRGSFGSSCRTRNQSDVVEKSPFLPHQQTANNDETGSVSSLKAQPFPTICRAATCPENASQVINHCTIPSRRKESHRRRYPPLVPNSGKGNGFPPASPASPLTRSYYQKKQSTQKQRVESKKKKKKATAQKRETSSLFSSSSLDSAYFAGSYYWFSSDCEEGGKGVKNGYENDEESDTLFFSSRSLSSDSSALSASRRHHRRKPRRRENHDSGRRKQRGGEIDNSSPKKGVVAKKTADKAKGGDKRGMLPLEGKVKGSFAVVKSSSDPYNDFRTSMVEMIIEKQIFGAKDLEQLLQCFLSLNADHHHRIIVEVFTEIWEALFSTWS